MRNYLKIFFACCLSVVKVQGQELTFISPIVEEGIRQHINITEDEQISFSQLDTITTLDLSRRGITDIRDLVLLPNIRILDLSDNMVDDLQPLTVLESLEWVDLSYNHLKGINELFYSTSKNLNIIVAFNNIKDFSLFSSMSSCNFTLEGVGLQFDDSAPYYDFYHFYTYFIEDEKPVVAYRGNTNVEAAWSIKCGSSNISAHLDGDCYLAILPKTPSKTTVVTLTNGEQSETTYVVPPAEFTAGAGKTVTLGTGLPDDYIICSAYASKGTVEIEGNTIKYTAPTNAVTDMVNFSYYQGSTLKGFSHFYVNRAKKGDVNGDRKIDSTDLMLMVNYIMGKDPTGIDLDAADVNKDTKVNVVDVTKVVDIINKNAIGNDDDGDIHNDVEPDDPVIGIDDPLDF